jgi:DNA-binding NtrC family response regulator
MATNKSGSVLIVDDDRDVLRAAKLYLKQHLSRVDVERNPDTISGRLSGRLENNTYDVVLLDMNFTQGMSSGKEGFNWLQKIQEIDPSLAVVLITAYGDVEKGVKAIKMGAADFVLKPWKNEQLLATVNSAVNLARSQRKTEALRTQQREINAQIDRPYQNMIGQSKAMKKIFKMIEKVAPTPANVLITGENGTGKELAARAVHRKSKRAEDVFINVDIGAIPENLFESELFGHEKGAFTDAKQARPGRFEVAISGTLFLDEIGNLPFALQSKLLKAIESRQITRVGSNKPVDIDIRLICATNTSIEKLSDKNHFRQDLLYRINTIHINMPPLRERRDDIPLLSRYFVDKFAKKYDKNIKMISQEALHQLKSYSWPGNVRELQHAVERSIIMAEGEILKKESFFLGSSGSSNISLDNENYNLNELEQSIIRKALDKHEGNISKSAEKLGISRAALYRRIEKYGL